MEINRKIIESFDLKHTEKKLITQIYLSGINIKELSEELKISKSRLQEIAIEGQEEFIEEYYLNNLMLFYNIRKNQISNIIFNKTNNDLLKNLKNSCKRINKFKNRIYKSIEKQNSKIVFSVSREFKNINDPNDEKEKLFLINSRNTNDKKIIDSLLKLTLIDEELYNLKNSEELIQYLEIKKTG